MSNAKSKAIGKKKELGRSDDPKNPMFGYGSPHTRIYTAKEAAQRPEHSKWLTQQIKKDNPAYYAVDRRARRARKSK